MLETYVTATDFRKHLAQIANCVAWRHDRCVITRHGQEMVALVSYEDLEYLRKHRPRKLGPPGVNVFSARAIWEDELLPPPPPPPGQEMITLHHPRDMNLAELRALHAELKGRAGESLDLDIWLARAEIVLWSTYGPSLGPAG